MLNIARRSITKFNTEDYRSTTTEMSSKIWKLGEEMGGQVAAADESKIELDGQADEEKRESQSQADGRQILHSARSG